jgi:hypothetical protein
LVRKRKKRKKRKNLVLAVEVITVSDLEYIFPQDLKMWAKSAGRKFLEAQDKIKDLSTNGIPASSYWGPSNKIIVLSDDNTIREIYG